MKRIVTLHKIINKNFSAEELEQNIHRDEQIFFSSFFYVSILKQAKPSGFNKITQGEAKCDEALLAKGLSPVYRARKLIKFITYHSWHFG